MSAHERSEPPASDSIGDDAARRLAEIVENSDDAIISQDLMGTITSWNPAAERLFGYTRAEAVGESINMIIPLDLRHEESDGIARIRTGGRVRPFDMGRGPRFIRVKRMIGPSPPCASSM